MPPEKETSPLHISVADDADGHHKSGVTPRSSSGWDGKLRVEKKLELANPEALSDPEYSDEDQVLPGEEIEADEGMYCDPLVEHALILQIRSVRRLPLRYVRDRLRALACLLDPRPPPRPLQSCSASLSAPKYDHRDRGSGLRRLYTAGARPLRQSDRAHPRPGRVDPAHEP